MKEENKSLVTAKEDLGDLPQSTAHHTVHGLVKSSGVTMEELAACINKSKPTLLVVLKTSNYPLQLIEVLDCMGYDAELVIRTMPKTKTPKGEG